MEKEIETTLKALRSRNLNGVFAEDSKDAKNKILDMIPIDAVVGIGDSTTVNQICVKKDLKKRGTKVLDAFERKPMNANIKDWDERFNKRIEESTVSDIFLTGTNAITQDGRLVNVDATGNRVAGMFWGHPMTIIVVGRNKITKNLDEAFYRIRNVIAPNHIKLRAELGKQRVETPCVIRGECNDCRGRNRVCNIFTLIEGKPTVTDINIIIINEDLGLHWDESWPRERIEKIITNYKKFVWLMPEGVGAHYWLHKRR